MKQSFSLIALSFLLLATVSCKKDAMFTSVPYDTELEGKALLKINFVSAYQSNPSFIIKINELPVSGPLTARSPYPGGGFNTGGNGLPDFLAVEPGSAEIKFVVPNIGTSNDSVVLYNETVNNLEAGKRYTFHVTDTADKIKSVLLEENIDRVDPERSFYTFVHLMPDVPFVDLYYGEEKLATRIGYLQRSDTLSFIPVNAADTWAIRNSDSSATSTPLAIYSSGSSTRKNRVYTIFSTGYKEITDAADPRQPFLSFFLTK